MHDLFIAYNFSKTILALYEKGVRKNTINIKFAIAFKLFELRN